MKAARGQARQGFFDSVSNEDQDEADILLTGVGILYLLHTL